MTRAPRLWRGTIRVDALLFDQPDATRRILAMWEPGATLLRCENGWLLRFPKSRWLRAQEAPGEPFVRIGTIWSSLRITEKETAQWPPRSIVRARHGVVVAEPFPDRSADPSQLIDVSDFVLAPLAPLVTPRAIVRPVPVIAPPTTRELLEVGEAAEEARWMREKLAKPGPRSRSEGGRVAAAGSAVTTFWQWVSQFFRHPGGSAGTRRGSGSRSNSDELALPPRELPLMQQLRSLANRLILATRLASFLGRKQAEYISNLLDLLQRQRFDEALRFAIPLSDAIVSSLGGLSFFNPTPRDDFTISHSRVPAAGMLLGGEDLTSMLRGLYRRAAEQLEREGKIERAAFVLADLLDRAEEAVSLLERHGKLRLAARLAEARNLAPDLVVRQWLLAGDRERAIAIARRHEAYELAIRRLEASHPELASMLRVEWAHALANRGAFGAAAEAVWPVEEERDRARTWLDEAIVRRGLAGARALARKLEWIEDERPATLRQIADLLSEEEQETATARAMLVTTLSGNNNGLAEVRTALRLGLRARIRDVAAVLMPGKATDFETLARIAGDGALRADLPVSGVSKPWTPRTDVLTRNIDASDRGMSKIHDAAMLEDGIVALALGEQGTVLLHRDGRTIARMSEPAFRLVISDQRDRALALAPREESFRVTRLDFLKRRATYWRDMRLAAHASTYDGATWFGAVDGALYAIDTTSAELASIWYNPDVGRVLDLARTPASVSFLNDKGELWEYDIPSYLLRTREQTGAAEEGTSSVAMPGRGLVEARAEEEGDRTLIRTGRTKADRVIGVLEGSIAGMVAHERWVGVLMLRGGNSQVVLLEAASGRARAILKFGASVPRLRMHADHLFAFDHEGRVVVIDLDLCAIVRDLRI